MAAMQILPCLLALSKVKCALKKLIRLRDCLENCTILNFELWPFKSAIITVYMAALVLMCRLHVKDFYHSLVGHASFSYLSHSHVVERNTGDC